MQVQCAKKLNPGILDSQCEQQTYFRSSLLCCSQAREYQWRGLLHLAIHVVQNPPCWRAKVALRQDKQRKLPFQIMYVFCLACPSATFALQHSSFVPREWLAAKGLLGTTLSEPNRSIIKIEEEPIRPRRRAPSSISIILHMIRVPNSVIVLLFIENNSSFKNKLKHAYLHHC